MKHIVYLLFFLTVTSSAFGQLIRSSNRSVKRGSSSSGTMAEADKVFAQSYKALFRGSGKHKKTKSSKKTNGLSTIFKNIENKLTSTKNDTSDWKQWRYHNVAHGIRTAARKNKFANKDTLWQHYINIANNATDDDTTHKTADDDATHKFTDSTHKTVDIYKLYKAADSTYKAKDSINEVIKIGLLKDAYREWTILHDFQFFPARNQYCAKAYYDENGDAVVQSLKNSFLHFSPYGGLVYSELASGYGGPIRVSFGGMIASSSLSKIDTATLKNTPTNKLDSLFSANDSINRAKSSIQNLLGGGGNAMLVLSTPLFSYHPGAVFNIRAEGFDKTCYTMPALGNEITDYSVVNGFGVQMDARFLFEQPSVSTFGFYANATGTILLGNKAFHTNLGVNPAKTLAFGQFYFGIILERFRIYFNYNVINDKSLQVQMPNCIGVNLTPF